MPDDPAQSDNELWRASLTRWFWFVGLFGAATFASGLVLTILVGMGVLEFTLGTLPLAAAVLGPNSLLFLAGLHLFRRFTLPTCDCRVHGNCR